MAGLSRSCGVNNLCAAEPLSAGAGCSPKDAVGLDSSSKAKLETLLPRIFSPLPLQL